MQNLYRKLNHRIGIIALLLIIGIGAAFRFTGINWDDNAHLHPDERFLTMVATNIHWPKSIPEYFDTQRSPANPQNQGFSFFVYGTYPVHFTKLVAFLVHKDTYDGITLVGRTLSGIADLLTLVTVYLIASYLTKKHVTGLIAAFCYAVAVLPIQLSHFFTVDPYVTLFTTVSLWQIVRNKFGLLLGIMIGLAVGAKISAAIILPIVLMSYLYAWPWTTHTATVAHERKRLLWEGILFVVGLLLTVRIVYPYLFVGVNLNPLILANWRQLVSFDGPNTTFPPGLQWIGVPPLQPILDLFVWGLSPVLGLLAVAGVITIAIRGLRKKSGYPMMILLIWTIGVSIYQATQFAKPMRYFWPIYPTLAVCIGIFVGQWYEFFSRRFRFARLAMIPICFSLLLWPIGYEHIYVVPTTRVSATQWIYTTIPPGATIAWESWDDPLPFPYAKFSPGIYHTPALPVFDPDTPEKWTKIAGILKSADYLILSSNRGYGAMGRVHARYPQTYRYYQWLFDGSLGFTQIAQFTSRPTLQLPGINQCIHIAGFSYGAVSKSLEKCDASGVSIVDDYADETFTVYDHPKVIILKKTQMINYSKLLSLPFQDKK